VLFKCHAAMNKQWRLGGADQFERIAPTLFQMGGRNSDSLL